MDRILGIDYGKRKIGLSLGVAGLAEPYGVLRVSNTKEAIAKMLDLISLVKPKKIIVGISEGETANETKKFVKELKTYSDTPIHLIDETLSSKDAQRMSIEAGISQKRRHKLEDSFAATIILQHYLDIHDRKP